MKLDAQKIIDEAEARMFHEELQDQFEFLFEVAQRLEENSCPSDLS